jgi:hypothetical protein
MKTLIAVIVLCFSVLCWARQKPTLSEKYPNRLITSDYGIITADDLAHDAEIRNATSYDPTKTLFARYWQCLPIKYVVPKYRTWQGEDGMGPSDVIASMCDLEIDVRAPNDFQIYSDRRARPIEYCQHFISEWQRVTSNQEIVCLNGDDGSYSSDKVGEKYKSWTWNKIKTRTGCFSFLGECSVRGCAAGSCPN